MTVLIRGPKSSGSCQRSCDARCYDAKCDHCVCICGGRNHGVGFRQANENTQDMEKEMTEQGADVMYQYSLPGVE